MNNGLRNIVSRTLCYDFIKWFEVISLERVKRNLIKWPMNNFIVLYLVLTICFNFLDAAWASQFQFQFMFVLYTNINWNWNVYY